MAIVKETEMHKRRSGRNLGVGLVLLAFVALVYGLTVAKMQTGDMMEASDHSPRVSMTPATTSTAEPTE